jgi:hypothetical protein
MDISFKKTKLDSWLEWKKECTLAKCRTNAQSDILDWASPHLRYVERSMGKSWNDDENRPLRTLDHFSAAWYEFEECLKSKKSKHGNLRKDVICDRALDWSDENGKRNSFEAQIYTEIRMAYRQDKIREQEKNPETPFAPEDHVFNENKESTTPEWNEVYSGGTELAQSFIVAQEKLSESAINEATAALLAFTKAERIAIVCKSLQIGLHKQEVLSAAECNKEQIYKAFDSAAVKFEAVLKEMENKYARESDPEDWDAFGKEFTRSFREFCEEAVPSEILQLARS